MLPFLNCSTQNGQLPPSFASMFIQFVSILVTCATHCCTPIAFDRGLQHTNRTMLVLIQIPAKAVKPPNLLYVAQRSNNSSRTERAYAVVGYQTKVISLLSFQSSLINNNRKKNPSDDYTLSQM